MVAKANRAPFSERYAHILDTCEPFLVSHRANWPYLDLAPFGVPIAKERTWSATELASREVVDGLHRLDGFSFGPEEMLMPRWVLFDCGEFPGIVFGFGRRASLLPDSVRARYQVLDQDDAFVPLSMWVAIRCVEPDAWFGHNLSSANLVLEDDDKLPGLATLTKLLAVRLTRARLQYGATQWTSKSLNIHLNLGPLKLLSAWTPAHTHPETFSYRVEVSEERLLAALAEGFARPEPEGDHLLAATDSAGILDLHHELEAGASVELVYVERGAPNRLRLRLR